MLSVPSSTAGCVVAVLRETGAEDGAEVPFVHALAHSRATPNARGHAIAAEAITEFLAKQLPEPENAGTEDGTATSP